MNELVCPECGSNGVVELQAPAQGFICICGALGTQAYFTPERTRSTEGEPQVVSRTFNVPRERNDAGHIKAVTSAMDLLVRASLEEGIDLDWSTLRLITGADETTNEITYLAVIKGYKKPQPPPLPVHDVGGVAVTTPGGGAKVVAPLYHIESPGPPQHITLPDAADVELARRSRVER